MRKCVLTLQISESLCRHHRCFASEAGPSNAWSASKSRSFWKQFQLCYGKACSPIFSRIFIPIPKVRILPGVGEHSGSRATRVFTLRCSLSMPCSPQWAKNQTPMFRNVSGGFYKNMQACFHYAMHRVCLVLPSRHFQFSLAVGQFESYAHVHCILTRCIPICLCSIENYSGLSYVLQVSLVHIGAAWFSNFVIKHALVTECRIILPRALATKLECEITDSFGQVSAFGNWSILFWGTGIYTQTYQSPSLCRQQPQNNRVISFHIRVLGGSSWLSNSESENFQWQVSLGPTL